MNADEIIVRTKSWIETVVVGCNFCPFAKRELERGTVRYVVIDEVKIEHCLERLYDEFVYLDSNDDIETTLIIFSKTFVTFETFLTAVDMSEQLLTQYEYDGTYQLASFHPNYCFAGSDDNDAANYTNRSPFPMLHLLREDSLEKALENYPDPEQIPNRNVEKARTLGLDIMKAKLDKCRHE